MVGVRWLHRMKSPRDRKFGPGSVKRQVERGVPRYLGEDPDTALETDLETAPESSQEDTFLGVDGTELVEALACREVEQHVLVAGVALARRLASCDDVTVGPIVKSPVMAYCLMPDVDLAHVHEVKSGQAGLLLTLTRTIPFVLTTGRTELGSKNPLTRSVFHRAAQIIPPIDSEAVDRAANEHLQVYANTLKSWVHDALML